MNTYQLRILNYTCLLSLPLMCPLALSQPFRLPHSFFPFSLLTSPYFFFFLFLFFLFFLSFFPCMCAVSMAMKASSKPYTCSSTSCLWAPFCLATDDVTASERHKNRFLIGLLYWQLHCRLCLEDTAKLLNCNGYQRQGPELSLNLIKHY